LGGGGAESKLDQPGGGRVPLGGRGILNPRVPSPPIAPGPARLFCSQTLEVVGWLAFSFVSYTIYLMKSAGGPGSRPRHAEQPQDMWKHQ
jgi:hypothetical protein